MLKKINYIIITLALLTAISCTRKMDRKEYSAWVKNPENGLVQIKEFKGVSFQLETVPPRSFSNEDSVKLMDIQQFNFKLRASGSSKGILHHNISDQGEYIQRLAYLMEPAQKDFMLINQGDSIYPTLYHFEEYYGLAPHNTIVLGFDREVINYDEDIFIVYDDKIFGNSLMKFRVKAEALKNERSIIL